MKYILLTLPTILVGCTQLPPPAWEKAPEEYTCTDAQQDRVHEEAAWCNEHTTYFETYCYGSAYIRNCTKKEPGVPHD